MGILRGFANEPAHDLTPQRIFERRWALTVLDTALESVAADYHTQDKAELFQTLKPLLIAGREAPPYRELAEQLDMTEGAVKVAVHRLRRHYGEALRRIVADTVATADEVDDELHALMNALGS